MFDGYIHLNPVEAKICRKPHQYKWSSYRHYANPNLSLSWLQHSFILGQMQNSRENYIQFIAQGINEKTQNFYNKKQLPSIMGNRHFILNNLEKINNSYLPAVYTDVKRTIPLYSLDIIVEHVIKYFSLEKIKLLKATQGKKTCQGWLLFI